MRKETQRRLLAVSLTAGALACIAALMSAGISNFLVRSIIASAGMVMSTGVMFIGCERIFNSVRLALKSSSARRPNFASFLLYLLLNKSDRETIPGDLDEEFTTVILPAFGPGRAWLWYWVQAIRTIAYRNILCRWLLIGGGILKVGEWITLRIRS